MSEINRLFIIVVVLCSFVIMPDLGLSQNLGTSSGNTQIDESLRLGWNKSIRVRGLMQQYDPFNDVKVNSINDSLEKFRELSEMIGSQDSPDEQLVERARKLTPYLSEKKFIKTESVATTFWVKFRDKLEKRLKAENNTLKIYKVREADQDPARSSTQPVYTGGEATTEYDIALQWLNDGLDVVKEQGVERIVGNNQGLGSAAQANDAVMIRNLESIVALTGNVFAQDSDISVQNFSDLSMFEVKFDVNIDETGFSYQPKLIILGMTFYRTQQDVPNYSSVMINEHYQEYTQSAIHALDKGVGLVLNLEDPETLEFLITEGIEIGGNKVNMSFYDLIRSLHYQYEIRSENEIVVQEATRFGYQDIEKFKNNMINNYTAIFLEQYYGKTPNWWADYDKGIVTKGLFSIEIPQENTNN